MSANQNAEAFLRYMSNLDKVGPIHAFAIKTAIVAMVIVISTAIVLHQLDGILKRRLEPLHQVIQLTTSMQDHVFWNQLEQQVEEAADPSNDLAPERKAKLVAAIETLAERWSPLLAAASAGASSGFDRNATESQK